MLFATMNIKLQVNAKTPTNEGKEDANMNIAKENTVYCDVLKIELSRKDINTGFNPGNSMYMRPVAAFLLAIIKSADIEIQNNIGKIFQGHNIIDYTYLDGELDIDHLYKSLAYTSLYKASGIEDDMIKANDVTLTIAIRNMPQHLFDNLKESGISIEKTSDGIYHLKGSMFFNTQIIVTGEMGENEQEWLKSLIEYVQNDFLPRLMLLGFDTCSKMLF